MPTPVNLPPKVKPTLPAFYEIYIHRASGPQYAGAIRRTIYRQSFAAACAEFFGHPKLSLGFSRESLTFEGCPVSQTRKAA